MNETVEVVRPLLVLSTVLVLACSGSNATVGPERTGPGGSEPGAGSSATSPAPSGDPGLAIVPPPGGDAALKNMFSTHYLY